MNHITSSYATSSHGAPRRTTPNPSRGDAEEAVRRGRAVRLAIAVGVALLGLLVTAGYRSYRDLAVTHAHEAELRAEIDATRQRIDALRTRIDRTENDPLELERLAREELGMARPGEVVILLPRDPAPQDSPESAR